MSQGLPYDQRPKIIVHGFEHAVAALEAARACGRAVTLLSAEGAVRSGGAGWWRELVARASETVPDSGAEWLLDCADEAGMALAALREGVAMVSLDADDATWRRVSEIAEKSGATLARLDRTGAFDLAGSNNPQTDCEAYLSGTPHAVAKPRALG